MAPPHDFCMLRAADLVEAESSDCQATAVARRRRGASRLTFPLLLAALTTAATPGMAMAANDLEIELNFVIVKDRITPWPKSGITSVHSMLVRLTSTKDIHVDSQFRFTPANGQMALPAKTFSEDAQLGSAARHVDWHVEGPHTLRGDWRIGIDGFAVLRVDTGAQGTSCQLNVSFRHENHSGVIHSTLAIAPGVMGTFGNWRVSDARCQVRGP